MTDADVEEVNGLLMVKAASRAVFEAATVGSVESGIVVMDSALHLGTVTKDELVEVVGSRTHWQGARRARYALSLADGRAESPGESRSRYLFRRASLPIPDLQVPVYDEDGRVIGYSDLGWIEYLQLGEFDGLVKYGGIVNDSRTPQQIVIAEKAREDAMRSQRLGMSRWTWVDIDPPREMGRTTRCARRCRASPRRVNNQAGQS